MSNAQEEFFNQDGAIGVIQLPVMVAGVSQFTSTIAQSPPFGPNSQVLGFQRLISGGTVGTPFVAGIDVGASPTFNEVITVKSSVITDTSTYKLYYVNPVAQSNVKSALSLV
jgi:hypothetical protein